VEKVTKSEGTFGQKGDEKRREGLRKSRLPEEKIEGGRHKGEKKIAQKLLRKIPDFRGPPF